MHRYSIVRLFAEVEAPLAPFDSLEVDSIDTVKSWRMTACDQGIFFRENREKLVDPEEKEGERFGVYEECIRLAS